MKKGEKHKEEKNKKDKEHDMKEVKNEKELLNEDNTDQEEEIDEKDELANLKNELNTYKDAFLRKAAEFENYKKRTDADISNYIKYASEHLITRLLPVLDDLNRSVESVKKGETKDFETLKQGLILVFDKFRNILEREGLKEVDVLGKEFNVDLCDALMQVPKSGVEPHTVIEVVEKGYYLKDKVIRHAKVLVSADDSGQADGNDGKQTEEGDKD